MQPYQAVTRGQMIGTLKIIPFAVRESPVRIAEALAGQETPLLRVAPFQPRDTIMIQSRLPGTKESVLDSTLRVTTDRLAALGAELVSETRCEHEILHFGMPVDPGNLMLIGSIGKIPVIGMPGCARSPKLNGFDWALQRICAGLDIQPRDIMRMGAGGLLKDVPHRPLPRMASRWSAGWRKPFLHPRRAASSW